MPSFPLELVPLEPTGFPREIVQGCHGNSKYGVSYAGVNEKKRHVDASRAETNDVEYLIDKLV
jgi:hypothetical protein